MCKHDNLIIGRPITINGNPVCLVCGQIVAVVDKSARYEGHVMLEGLRAAQSKYDEPRVCEFCGEVITHCWDYCEPPYFRLEDVQSVSKDELAELKG